MKDKKGDEKMIYIERALSDRSMCTRCNEVIKVNRPRIRLKLTHMWGFSFCSKCIDDLISEWENFKQKEFS